MVKVADEEILCACVRACVFAVGGRYSVAPLGLCLRVVFAPGICWILPNYQRYQRSHMGKKYKVCFKFIVICCIKIMLM